MVKRYWGRICRRAWAETAALLGLDTWAHFMIRALFVCAIIIALIIYGSSDAAADHAIERTAVFIVAIFLVPFIFAWKLVTVPAKLDAEVNPHGQASSDPAFEFGSIQNELVVRNPGEDLGGERQY